MHHIDESTASSPAPLVPANEFEHGPRNQNPGSSPSEKAPSETNALNTTDTDVIIAVMGATGSGKSTFVNLISGSELHVGTGLRSCTSDVEATAPFDFQGRRLVMFDTPGFDDTTKSDTDILKLVATFLATTYENGTKLAGVIYMHRINDIRMGGIAVRNFGMFRKLCGDKSLKNVAIVTNFWSEVDPAVGDAREAELRSDGTFFKPVLDKQAKLLRHDGTLAAAHAVIAQIVGNQPIALLIQEELVDEHKDISATAAVTELNRELEEQAREQARKHAEELEQIRKDMEVATKKREEQKQQELEAAEKKLQAEKEREQTELRRLAAQRQEEMERLEQRTKEAAEAAQRAAEAHERQMRELREHEQRVNDAHRHEMHMRQREVDEMNRRHEEERNRGGGCIIA